MRTTLFLLATCLLILSDARASRRFTWNGEASATSSSAVPGYEKSVPDGGLTPIFSGYNGFRAGADARSGNVSVIFRNESNGTCPSYRTYVDMNTTGGMRNLTAPFYVRIWIYVYSTHMPAANMRIFAMRDTVFAQNPITLGVNTTGKIYLGFDASVVQTMSTAYLDQWIEGQLYTTWGSSGVTTTLELMGETLTSTHNCTDVTTISIAFGCIDNTNGNLSPVRVAMDDIAFNDAAGSFENGPPPDSGRGFALLTIADVSLDGWVAGDGSTTDLSDALDNRRPTGQSSETATTNIYNVTSSATDRYTVDFETYSSVGLTSADVLVSLQIMIRHGEHAATGTETGAFRMSSNPADAGEVTFTWGSDGGAHASDLTYDCGDAANSNVWYTTRGDIVTYPTVTLGTSPRGYIERRTANTNKICVDQFVIIGEYIPSSETMRGKILD